MHAGRRKAVCLAITLFLTMGYDFDAQADAGCFGLSSLKIDT